MRHEQALQLVYDAIDAVNPQVPQARRLDDRPLRRSGLRAAGDNAFAWDTSESYPQPAFVTLRDRARVAPAGNR
jgi:hypothetical protein